MAISKIPIFEMRSAMRKELIAVGLYRATIESYLCSLNHLVRFMEEQSLEEYSADVGKSFMHCFLVSSPKVMCYWEQQSWVKKKCFHHSFSTQFFKHYLITALRFFSVAPTCDALTCCLPSGAWPFWRCCATSRRRHPSCRHHRPSRLLR